MSRLHDYIARETVLRREWFIIDSRKALAKYIIQGRDGKTGIRR
jgi:hypothetical protein